MTALEQNVVVKFQQKVAQLRCDGCGITGAAYCNCGVGYSVVKARDAVIKYDKAHPGESSRKVAKAIGVHQTTVAEARRKNQGKENAYPVLNHRRVFGGDGKNYPATIKQPARKTGEQILAKKLADYITRNVLLLDKARVEDQIKDKDKRVIIEILQISADSLLRLAQALDDR